MPPKRRVRKEVMSQSERTTRSGTNRHPPNNTEEESEGEESEDDKHLTLTEKVISKAARSKKGFLRDAWVLAQGLMQLPGCGDGDGDDNGKKMWKVIKGVWVEMLCFSAGRCRGYLHAKSLGSGGEYLSYVWLLLLHMGMETLTEKMQRTAGFPNPTGPVKPPPSGSGLPDRFDRKPVETG